MLINKGLMMNNRDRYDIVIGYLKKLSVNNFVPVSLQIQNELLQRRMINKGLHQDLAEEPSNYNMSIHVPSLFSSEEDKDIDNDTIINVIKQRGNSN